VPFVVALLLDAQAGALGLLFSQAQMVVVDAGDSDGLAHDVIEIGGHWKTVDAQLK